MKRKTTAIWAILALLTITATFLSFVKYFVLRDYRIIVDDECDPTMGNCFVYEEDGEISLYRKVIWIARSVPNCDPQDIGCNATDCAGHMDCTVEYCDENTKSGDEVCADTVGAWTDRSPSDDEAESDAT